MKQVLRLTAAAMIAGVAFGAAAQRVQFPTATQPLAAPPPTTFSAPPPSASPFATNPVTPPLFSAPPTTFTPSPVMPPAVTTPAPAPFTTPAPTTIAPPPMTSAPITPIPSAPTFSTPAPYPSTAPPTFTTPAPFNSPAMPAMPAPSLTTPPPTIPPATTVAPPPPTFDPYAGAASPLGPPPPSVPYTYTPPGAVPPPTTVGPQTSPLYPDGIPWQPGNIGFDGDSYYQKTLRVLQEMSFEYTWLYGRHADPSEMEINRFELSSTFAVPMMYNVDTPLLITPGFAFNFLEGPLAGAGGPEMPPQLYDAYLDFAWYPKVTPWLGAELGFRPGVWSDFDHVTSDSIRLLGRGLASVSVTPQLDILFGVVYLDRVKVKILPAGGVYWRPTPEWDAYIVFPNPKVRRYWMNVGNTKMYWYVAGEYGMGSWTADYVSNPSGRVDINDIRVLGGIECETHTQIRSRIEVGYVWDRELVFDPGPPIGDYKLDDTVMIRAGVDF